MYVFSDGGFSTIPDFKQGTLTTKYVKVGDDAADNIAISGFSTERNPENGKLQAFARIENGHFVAQPLRRHAEHSPQLTATQEAEPGA